MGTLDSNGAVTLDQDLSDSSYWQSNSHILFTNGTLKDRKDGSVTQPNIKIATVNKFGKVHTIKNMDLNTIKAVARASDLADSLSMTVTDAS